MHRLGQTHRFISPRRHGRRFLRHNPAIGNTYRHLSLESVFGADVQCHRQLGKQLASLQDGRYEIFVAPAFDRSLPIVSGNHIEPVVRTQTDPLCTHDKPAGLQRVASFVGFDRPAVSIQQGGAGLDDQPVGTGFARSNDRLRVTRQRAPGIVVGIFELRSYFGTGKRKRLGAGGCRCA